jgi:uncharacterized membrane protein
MKLTSTCAFSISSAVIDSLEHAEIAKFSKHYFTWNKKSDIITFVLHLFIYSVC